MEEIKKKPKKQYNTILSDIKLDDVESMEKTLEIYPEAINYRCSQLYIYSLLYYAVECGSVNACKYLAARPEIDVNLSVNHGDRIVTPIKWTSIKNRAEINAILLAYGAKWDRYPRILQAVSAEYSSDILSRWRSHLPEWTIYK